MIRYTEIKNRKNHTLRAMLNLPDGQIPVSPL